MSYDFNEKRITVNCSYCGHTLGVFTTQGDSPGQSGESTANKDIQEDALKPVGDKNCFDQLLKPKYLDLIPNPLFSPLYNFPADTFIDDIDGTHTDGDILNEEMLEEDIDACANGKEAHVRISGRDAGWVIKYFVEKVKALIAKKKYSAKQIQNIRQRYLIRPEMGMFNVDPVDGTITSLAPSDHPMTDQRIRSILASLFAKIDDLPSHKQGEKWYQIWDANGVAKWFTDDNLELANYYQMIGKSIPAIPFCTWAQDKKGMGGGEIHRYINPENGKKEVRYKLTDPKVISATVIIKEIIKSNGLEKFVRSFNVPTCMNLEALRADGSPYCKATAAWDAFEEISTMLGRSKTEQKQKTIFRGDGTADFTLALYINSPIVFVGDPGIMDTPEKITDPEQSSQLGKVIAKSKSGAKGSKVTQESTHLCRQARVRKEGKA